MKRAAKKYVLDSQLFIDAFRDPEANAALQEFHGARAPFEYLSAVVAQELRAGPQAREVGGGWAPAAGSIAPPRTAHNREKRMLVYTRGEREVPVIVEDGRVTIGFGGT